VRGISINPKNTIVLMYLMLTSNKV